MADALAFIADPSLDLVVLHLAPPHYPWIYDAVMRRYTLMGFGAKGYVGNLALADATLGEIRAAVRSSGRETATTLVVTSDHPWRQSRSLDGRADPRVPLLVRLAGDAHADTLHARLNTVLLGDFVLATLGGEIRSSTDLARWFSDRAALTGRPSAGTLTPRGPTAHH